MIILAFVQSRRRGHVLHLRAIGVADQRCLEAVSLALHRNKAAHRYSIMPCSLVSFLGIPGSILERRWFDPFA